MKCAHRVALAALLCLSIAPLAAMALYPPADARNPGGVAKGVATRACSAIAARVDSVAGSAPLLLRSYDASQGSGAVDEPALRTAAFTYDNALAVIALLACDRRVEALRVGSALERAAIGDSRLRNTYRAGPLDDKILPNGWWDATQNRWIEDAYQSGTSTGNVAWTALALLGLHEATGAAHWRESALKLARWVVANTRESSGVGGFNGGVDGFDAAPVTQRWRSTEHAIDLVALFTRLADGDQKGEWLAEAAHARAFLEAQWDASSGHFLIGSLPDGATSNRTTSALDVQWWSQLLPGAPSEWRRAMTYAERRHGVAAGFDFNDDRDGEWMEGTAQAALAYHVTGRQDDAQRRLVEIAAQFSPGGYVFATREQRITTGLSIGASSTSADFYYYRRPHLGATAWTALAALDRNPYRAAP